MLLERLWSYRQNYTEDISGVERDAYLVYEFGSKRRNPLLFLIPTMYSIAKGNKQYLSEAYCKVKFNSDKDYDLEREIVYGTIPSNRRVMPALFELTTPVIYSEQLYQDRLLSPFHRNNSQYYIYGIRYENDEKAYLTFTPRLDNTQLVKGTAVIDVPTGGVLYVLYEGEFDMIKFKVQADMNLQDKHGLPEKSNTNAVFKFVGNHIEANFTAYYNVPKLEDMPDSLKETSDREKIAALRPVPLTARQQAIYQEYADERQQEALADTIPHKPNKLKKVAWDVVGYHLVNSTRARSDNSYLRISPLFNPLYMSYSNSKGISYKLKIYADHYWSLNRFLTFDASLGYNTRKDQFYYTVPLRLTYNQRRNGYAEIKWGNGSRTASGAVNEDFKQRTGDSIDTPEFKDEYLQAINNIKLADWLELSGGVIYRVRRAMKPAMLRQIDMPDQYRSFSPLLTVRLTPWADGPTLTANYEHSFKNILRSQLSYDRWEFDMSYKQFIKSMRIFNLRLGAGFYTHRNSTYFVYYNNFKDDNLPSGWEDDWSGQFQLVTSNWYNTSNYYLRGHVSYDTPLLMLTWIPWIGRYIEMERIYLSALSIEHTRPYFEVGYGLKNRYFSTALFASFLNLACRKIGCKFTFELFRRW